MPWTATSKALMCKTKEAMRPQGSHQETGQVDTDSAPGYCNLLVAGLWTSAAQTPGFIKPPP